MLWLFVRWSVINRAKWSNLYVPLIVVNLFLHGVINGHIPKLALVLVSFLLGLAVADANQYWRNLRERVRQSKELQRKKEEHNLVH